MTKLKAILFDYDGTLRNSRSGGHALYDGVQPLLMNLQVSGYAIGLVTAAPDPWEDLNRLGIDTYFTSIVGAKDLTEHKPDPQGIDLALERLGLAPEDAIYIGDTMNDIYAAQAAKLRATIGVTHGFANRRELETAGADYIIDSLAEVLDVLGRIEQ